MVENHRRSASKMDVWQMLQTLSPTLYTPRNMALFYQKLEAAASKFIDFSSNLIQNG